jgi:tetratricopeptide (TPR) repeat protein
VTAENRATVTEIVRLLDGLPLAIELAASRVRMLSLEQLRERLGNRFSVLAGSKRGRHGTLRGTLDWSWSLLTPWEQSAVTQASIFQGGFTLDAAEAVIDLTSFQDAPMVLDVIQSLVDKSWLRARVVLQAPRFTMYATVQEYAMEKSRAAEGGTADDGAAERHGRYFATMGTEKAIEAIDRHGGAARRAALRLELDNLIAACRASVARGSEEVASATYLAAALVLDLQGPSSVSVGLGEEVLPLLKDPSMRERVLSSLAWAERAAGKMREAQSHCEAALAIAREMGDRPAEARRLRQLGMLHLEQGRTEEARSCFEAALGIHRDVGIRGFEGVLRIHLGVLDRRKGRLEEARVHYEAALALARKEGHQRLEGTALGNLAVVLRDLGRFEESRSRYGAALAIHRAIGDREAEGIVLGNLGGLEAEQGLMDEARSSMEAALAIHREVGNRRAEGHAIGSLGAILTAGGRVHEAKACFEAAIAIHREVGSRLHEGGVQGYLANLFHKQDRFEEARPHYEAAIALHREVGDRGSEGTLLACLGYLYLDLEQLAEARRCMNESLAILREVGGPLALADVLCKRGHLEWQAGDLDAARADLVEAEQISEAHGAARPELARDIAELREALAKAVPPEN